MHGYDSTSMEMLARELGITKSAIYHHVNSKEELLRLALDQALISLQEVLEMPGTHSGRADARLEFVIYNTVLVLAEQLPYVTLLLRLRGNSPIELAALQRRRAFDARMREIVDLARAQGYLRRDIDSATTARLIFGTINSVVEWYERDGRLTPEELATDVVRTIMTGVGRGGPVRLPDRPPESHCLATSVRTS